MVARGVAVRGRVPRFWSREVMEHICGVGFIRRILDLHRSDKLSHNLLGCWILTQHRWLRDAVESRSSRQACMTLDCGVHMRIFFAS